MSHLNKLPVIGYECPTYTTLIGVDKNVPLIHATTIGYCSLGMNVPLTQLLLGLRKISHLYMLLPLGMNVPLMQLFLGLRKMSHLYMLLLIGYECPTFTLFIGVKNIPQLCKLPLNTLGMNVPLKNNP